LFKVKKKDMQTTRLTPAQLNILTLMEYIDTEQEEQELRSIILKFYQQKLDRMLLNFQSDNNITQQTLDDWTNQHERTSYK